jgi:sortase (surface protein transpeptidase)
VVAVVIALNMTSSRDPSHRTLSSSTTSLVTSTTQLQGLTRSIPMHLTVPSLGISTSIGELGLQADNQVQVPTSVHTVGWFRLGPTPGEVGSSVILGHVDSYQGPGIFFNLKTMRAGDLIEVQLADGLTAQFRVTSVVQYAKTSFPDALVYGAQPDRGLNLVTCGGTFNHQTHSYESNIVVFSRLVGTRGVAH